MVFRRRTFPQQAHWHIQVHQEQRNAKPKSKYLKTLTTGESVVELIQNAAQVRIPSPPLPVIQIGHISPPDPRIRYNEYKQEKEMSVWDAENEI